MSKKEEILKSALKLFVEFGFHAAPTGKIAKEAGVANGTLFHYYKTKEELILALYTDTTSRLNAFTFTNVNNNDSLESVFNFIYTNTIGWAQENKKDFYFIQQFSVSTFYNLISSEEITKQTKPYLDLLNRGIKEGVLKQLPPELIYILFNNHIAGVNQYLSAEAFSLSEQKKIIKESFQLLWDMIS